MPNVSRRERPQVPRRVTHARLRATPRPAGGRRFDYELDYKALDLRRRPELYRVGVGEQGVLLVRPYKDELLPLWRFRDPEVAEESARALSKKFHEYKAAEDFVGMDMARKFLQMGFTRARRYANHASGRKYDPKSGEVLARNEDPVKAAAAAIFFKAWKEAEADETYADAKKAWKAAHG